MDEDIATLRGQAEGGRAAYRAGTIGRARAAELVGPYLDAAPDFLVGYHEGYRASWDGAVGKVSATVLEDNHKAWSGDHCVDPVLVPGVLFSNQPIQAADPGIEDLAATALQLFGVNRPTWMEGRSVL